MKNQPNPDDRQDNAEKIRNNIDMTIHNMELAEDMIGKTSDTKTKKALSAKNARREEALSALHRELKDESEEEWQ